MIKRLTAADFEEAFGEPLSQFVKDKIAACDLSYHTLDTHERDNVIMSIMNTLSSSEVKKSGAHRINDWIYGWGQNRDEFAQTSHFQSLVPKYFGKFPYVRWQQDFIRPVNRSFEYNTVKILQYWIFEKHFANLSNVHEFGCGTGHNLFRVQEVNDTAAVAGLDWASSSQDNIKKIDEVYNKNFGCHNFDFFNVDTEYNMGDNSGAYTFAALEQVGGSHTEFLNYLVSQKPSVCVHIEPIGEMLNPEHNFVDYLSVQYFKKRNYLDGFMRTLHDMQAQGTIEIIQQQRSYVGSLFVDGYSVVAWRPKNA